MAFSYDPTVDRGKVRLLVFDTDTVTTANQIFTDQEIDAFLSLADQEVLAAAAMACRSVTASASRSALNFRADKIFGIDRRDVPKRYLELANEYEAKAVSGTPWEIDDSLDYVIDRFGRSLGEYRGEEL